MNTTERLRVANDILRQLDGDFPGSDGIHQKFKWCWSQDLVSLVPAFGLDGEIQYRYVCGCGEDRAVHAVHCSTLVRALPKMTQISSLGPLIEDERYRRAWILSNWIAPPSLDSWIESMGTEEDYPADGRYVPVSVGRNMVSLPSDRPPSDHDSWTVVRMVREHAGTWKQRVAEEADIMGARVTPLFDDKGNMLEPAHKTSSYHKMHDRLKSRMTLNGHIPGKKDNTLIFTEKEEPVNAASSTAN